MEEREIAACERYRDEMSDDDYARLLTVASESD